ncbi:MAG: hypothetical protein AcusKO_26600 [Acuticoccus sp.]
MSYYEGNSNDNYAVLYGSNDVMLGMDGRDTLRGGGGRDVLKGGRGDDDLYGGLDSDTLWGQRGDDELFGDDGNDVLDGGDGADTLFGGEGDDLLKGGNGNDHLYGGGQDDYSDAGDTLKGGNGSDKFYLDSVDIHLYLGSDNDKDYIKVVEGMSSYAYVHDFKHGKDKVDLRALDVDENSVHIADDKKSAYIETETQGVCIDLEEGGKITIDDFIF